MSPSFGKKNDNTRLEKGLSLSVDLQKLKAFLILAIEDFGEGEFVFCSEEFLFLVEDFMKGYDHLTDRKEDSRVWRKKDAHIPRV